MNSKMFKKRLRCLYTTWKKHNHRLWGGSDVLVISTISSSDDDSTISNHFHLCLLGYIFPDIITIFTFKEIHFICNNNHNSSSLLKGVTSSSKEAVGAHVIIHENENTNDANTLVKQILSKLQNQQVCPLIVGHVAGEGEESLALVRNEFQIVDIKNGLSKFAVLAEGIGQARFSMDGKGDFPIYLQELSKEAEEKILLADVKRVDMNTLSRRRKKVEEIGETDEYDDVTSEWILV